MAGVLTLFLHKENPDGTEYWFNLVLSYSWWLEALAFVPQIIMLNKQREVENLTS